MLALVEEPKKLEITSLDCVNAATGLLVISNVGFYVVARKAPRVGAVIGLTAYVASGVAIIAGVAMSIKEARR